MLKTDPELGVILVFLCVSADPAAAKLCLLLIFAHLGCSLQLIAFFWWGGVGILPLQTQNLKSGFSERFRGF